MITKLSKFAAAFAAAALLFGCSNGSAPDTPQSAKKTDSALPTGSAESSIFGRSVKYDAYSPAENLELPIPTSEITDTVQIEKRLYFLGSGGVYLLDTESGESGKLFDAQSSVLAAHGGKFYCYSLEDSTLTEYDPSTGGSNGIALSVDGADSVEELEVTDSYYLFKCRTVGEKLIETNILIYSRETMEQTLSKAAPDSGIRFYPYKGDKLFSMTMDVIFGAMHLNEYDVETGKSKNLQNLNTAYYSAAAYCPRTDTAVVFGIPNEESMKIAGDSTAPDTPCSLTEFSLSDTDSIVLNRYHIDVKQNTEFFVGVYENSVFIISSADNECRVYDFMNPPESITILGYANSEVIYGFERETGILVRIANTDSEKTALKLMAGDDDFDLFNTGSGFQNYTNAGTFVDLKTVESLRSRISKSKAAEMVVSCDGKYFGVPTVIGNYCTEENFPEDGSSFCYSLAVSEAIYCAQNIDVAEGRYDDPDGEKLYKLFKFLNDNPEGNRNKMPFGEEITLLDSNVYLMNPKSQNADNAIRFLEYIFDVFNGDIPGIVPESSLNLQIESTENCYAEWRCRPLDLIGPIFDARNTINMEKGKMSSNEFKKLAREAAAEVAMRIGE